MLDKGIDTTRRLLSSQFSGCGLNLGESGLVVVSLRKNCYFFYVFKPGQ